MVSIDHASVIEELLSRCITPRSLKLGKALHSNFIKTALNFNYFIVNRLIDLYSKCRSIGSAHNAFEDLPFKNARSWNTIVSASSKMDERDVVSWTLMVAAYARASRQDDANRLFNQMPHKNTVGWTSLMAGFAQNGQNLALLEKGKQIHGHVVKSFNREDLGSVYANNALLDMYCKCGDMRSSKKLFEGMGSTVPNHVTFLGVLSACSHTGSLPDALRILEQMEKDYHIFPRSEHYAVLIDLLGRKNRLSEAMEFVERTPVLSDHVGIWGALLGACRIHQNVDLAMKAAETLFKMEPSTWKILFPLLHCQSKGLVNEFGCGGAAEPGMSPSAGENGTRGSSEYGGGMAAMEMIADPPQSGESLKLDEIFDLFRCACIMTASIERMFLPQISKPIVSMLVECK
ncbi:Pentatricopeptide repeat-containing protein At5g44230 [Linum perenne]